jgi:hypothetical protein
VETFIIEQGSFWRRSGMMVAVMLGLLVLGLLAGIMLGALGILGSLS